MARRLYVLVAIAVAAVTIFRGFDAYADVVKDFPHDAHIDWGGARVILDGGDPYSPAGLRAIGLNERMGLGHPPTILVWFLPLARFDVQKMKVVWDELTLVALLSMILLAVLELGLPAPAVTTALVFGLVLSTSWMRDHLWVAQLSTLVALLFTIAWVRLRRDDEIGAGVALGLACTLKFYPGTVVILLLVSRRWRLALAAAASWAVVAIGISWRLGLSSWQHFLKQTEWYQVRWGAHIRNASLAGIAQRLHYPVCESYSGADHPVWRPGTMIAGAASLALMAGAWWFGRAAVRDRRTVDLPFALFVVVSMITGPYTWEHYNVTLVVPLLVALATLLQMRREDFSRRTAIAGTALLCAIALLLRVDMYYKTAIWRQYSTTDRTLHWKLHLLELFNELPAPLTILLIILLIRWQRERGAAYLR